MMSCPDFRQILSMAVTCLLTCMAVAQHLIVCPACSHESSGGNFCQHCGSPLSTTDASPVVLRVPETPPAEVETPTTPEAPAIDDDAARLVRDDLRAAAAYALATPEGAARALAALSNAKAVFAAFPSSAVTESERQRLHAGIVAARNALFTARIVCPRCNGKGLEDDIREFAALDGKSVTMKAGRITCRRCGGEGNVAKIRSGSELRSILAAGRQHFAETSLLAARVKSGNAWIAPELEAAATAKQQALLRRNSADPCPGCAGFGRSGCAVCNGTRLVKCPNRDCRNGRIENKPPTLAGANQSRIATAVGSRFTPCPTCKGAGDVVCETCGGSGAAACATCKGEGERKACAKCHAEGVIACRPCKGSGKDKQGRDCLACGAQGIVICTTCGGDGYGK